MVGSLGPSVHRAEGELKQIGLFLRGLFVQQADGNLVDCLDAERSLLRLHRPFRAAAGSSQGRVSVTGAGVRRLERDDSAGSAVWTIGTEKRSPAASSLKVASSTGTFARAAARASHARLRAVRRLRAFAPGVPVCLRGGVPDTGASGPASGRRKPNGARTSASRVASVKVETR
jgi:hypothetical protein